MGVIPFYTKSPTERFTIGLDFTQELPSGVTLTSGICVAINRKTEAVATSVLLANGTTVTISGNIGKISIDGGVSGTWYEVHFTMTCSSSTTLKGKAVVFVE